MSSTCYAHYHPEASNLIPHSLKLECIFSLLFFIIFLNRFKSFSIVFNQPFLLGSHTTFVSVFCSPLFCFHVCLFLKQPIICNFILETLALILHVFCFVWKYIKGHVLVWTIEIFLAIMSTSETVILINHKLCVFFFSFMYLFLKQWCCCFLQLIKIFSASLRHLVFLFIIFPPDLHTCFLIYTNDKILPNKSVLKRCLVAYSSDSFLLSK